MIRAVIATLAGAELVGAQVVPQNCTNFFDELGNSASGLVAPRDLTVNAWDPDGYNRHQCFTDVDIFGARCHIGSCQPVFNLSIHDCAILTSLQSELQVGDGGAAQPTTLFMFGVVDRGTFCMPCTERVDAHTFAFPTDDAGQRAFVSAALGDAGVFGPGSSYSDAQLFSVLDVLAEIAGECVL